MAKRVRDVVELGDGWRLTLPNECMAERNADGSWSAWDELHTIDVHILTTAGRGDGSPLDAATMLARSPTLTGEGWVGYVDELAEPDSEGLAQRFAIAAAAENTLLSCWVAYRDPAERSWAEAVCRGLAHDPKTARRRWFRGR